MDTGNGHDRAYVQLRPGDPAPWFRQRLSTGQAFSFDKAAGRYVILCFFASGSDPQSVSALRAVSENRSLLDSKQASFFGISLDKTDEAMGRIRQGFPDLRVFWDFDGAVSRAYGSAPVESAIEGTIAIRRFFLVLDPMLRVMCTFPLANAGAGDLLKFIAALPPPGRIPGGEMQAPVLLLPNVFEPDLCRALIDTYEAHGGAESGFMREIGGRTTLVSDPVHKRRKDCTIVEKAVLDTIKARLSRRLVPEISKAFQFHVTRIERFIVACYADEDRGHFNAHRDNTTKGTAHRRFAVSLNLNDDYEGGELRFPEFGTRVFKPPRGAALVFSCSLLHAANPVTQGRRFVFLPFLYDEAAAKIRQENRAFLDPALARQPIP
jgi:peroxiredoxin/predicted 2-oxoglutarate/Fe(II)-dependent dioxygenase YbiX